VPIRAVRVLMMTGVLVAGAARAEPPSGLELARLHFENGAALAADRKYDEAAHEFQASYELDRRKEALFAWAQMARLGGNCAMAVELYRKFMASPDLTPTQSEAAELNIHRCESPPETKADTPAAVAAGSPTVVATPPPPPARRRRAVVAGAVLAGGAGVALAAAVTTFLLSRNDERAASSADSWDAYYGPASRARSRQRLALGLAGGSVLLAGGALLEWLVTAPRAAPDRERIGAVTGWVAAGGAGAALQGRF
jgi:hypothetical protein